MEENLKKDLKELKEEVEKDKIHNEELKDKESSEEVITPEKAEGLVEKLIKTEEETGEKEPQKRFTKTELKKLLWGLGSFLIIILIILGVWTSLKLIRGDFYKKKKDIEKNSDSAVMVSQNDLVKGFNKLLISTNKTEENHFYKLELKNFLIPLDSRDFLNLDIFLYFDNSTSIKEITKKELDFRKILYNYFKNFSADKWENIKDIQILEEEVKKKLEKEHISPLPKKVKLEGILLKG